MTNFSRYIIGYIVGVGFMTLVAFLSPQCGGSGPTTPVQTLVPPDAGVDNGFGSSPQ